MDEREEQIWRAILDNRHLSAEEIATIVGSATEEVQALINRISSPNWREEKSTSRPMPQPTRVTMLNTAKQLTSGDRNKSYGPPYDNLKDCAHMWEAYINNKFGCLQHQPDGSYAARITAEDVAWMMNLLKMTRTFYPGYHPDNYVDGACYAAIAGECREIEDAEG